MKKIMEINGMSCEHCSAKVEKTLNSIDGVKAKVNLKKKTATITLEEAIDNSVLSKAVENAGYEVVAIKDKKHFSSLKPKE